MLANTLETYAPPRQLGRYELIAPLGEGGMARVYLAVQRGPVANKLVVIKLLREQFTGDEHFVAMFADESRIAVLLNHPNVIHTYESSSTGSEYYIVMEFLEGKTLGQLIRRVGREKFPLETHLWVLCEILSGLNYAHQLGDFGGVPLNIVHRDVSPSNILITVRGEVKLLDFGIAKVQGSIVETQHGIIKGKLGYASPEQCLGTKADGRADVYSVGVMLWEALAGKRRPLSETALATTRNGSQTGEIDIAETLPGVPLALARIVRRALARDPAERYQTALAFELELRQYLVDKSCSNGAPSLQALISGHFGGELAGIRRAIEDQVGSIRHSMVPEPRSVFSRPPGLNSEAPHNIGVTTPPQLPANRLRQASIVAAIGVAVLAGTFLLSRLVPPSSTPEQESKAAAAAAAARAPEAAPLAQPIPAQPQLGNSARSAAADDARDSLAPADAPGAFAKPRPLRVDHPQAVSVAAKARSAPALPLPGKAPAAEAPIAAPVVVPSKPTASTAPSSPSRGGNLAEPGTDLRQGPSKSNTRSLDERDPYAP